MNQFVSLYCSVINLFLSLLVLHLQHSHTVTQELHIVLNLILVLFNLTVGSGLLLLHGLRKILLLGLIIG